MTNLIFITDKELDSFPHYPQVKSEEEFKALWEKFPSEHLEALAYFEHQKAEDIKISEASKKKPSEFYLPKEYAIPEHFFDGKKRKTVLYCVARLLGEMLFIDWKMKTPEVVEAVAMSKVYADKYYDRFREDPELKAEYLDHLKDRSAVLTESRKIERR